MHLRIFPSIHLRVVLDNSILTVLTMNEIQTAGEWESGIHRTQSFYLRRRKLTVGSHRILERAIFLDVQRTTLLNIFHHIEVVNKVFRFESNFDAICTEVRCSNLRMSSFIRVITINTEILSFLLVENSSTIVCEAVTFHRSVHISLCSFFCFFQSVVIQLFIKTIFTEMFDFFFK